MDYREEDKKVPTCLQCGEELGYGRKDRKFCCEECKNKYHNSRTNSIRAFRSRINGVLEKNYRILENQLMQGRDSMDLMEAENLGFSPDFVTFCHKMKGRIGLGCFDIRYMMSDNRISGIHKIQNVSLNLHHEHKEQTRNE